MTDLLDMQQATMTFTSPEHVVPDAERPGLLRSISGRPEDGDTRQFSMRDLSAAGVDDPGLENAGFETIDLSTNEALQTALAEVREADELTDETVASIRASLAGATARLSSGASIRFDYLVEDGMFHRRSGPNGLDVNPTGMDGPNGHGGAQMVHGDQDVFGTPLRQLMAGAAPDSFRHVTPDGRNDDATTFLLNLWIPIYAPVQPLALMDRRSLDVSQHQLRYGLPVEDFLDRDEDKKVNDIWKFLYDEGQEWYLRTDMGSGQAYVFDTLGLAHGAAILAGEDALEEAYVAILHTCEAVERGDTEAALKFCGQRLALAPPSDATPTIRDAWQQMAALLERGLGAGGADAWCAQARIATDAVIRRSIEMRLVASFSPGG